MKGLKNTPEETLKLKAEIKAHRLASKNINFHLPVTMENLKSDRNEVIETITEMVGANEVKAVMSKMIDNLLITDCTDAVDYTKEIIYKMDYFNGISAQISEQNREAGRNLMSIR